MTTNDEAQLGERIEMLARLNEDACNGYAAAADLARNVPLSRRLLKWSDDRKEFAKMFRRENERAGVEPSPKGTPAASVHRAWMGLRHFATGSDEALLEECLRGESTAIASYEFALARIDWSARSTFRMRVASQLTTIRSHARELEADLMTRIGSKNHAATLRRARVLVRSRHALTIATIGEGGPWASSVSYVNDDFTFYFLSDPTCRHACNMQSDARVAGAINDDFSSWNDIRGIQLEGRADLISDVTTRADVLAKLFSRFPYLHAIEGDAEDVAAESSYALFKITPSRVWLVDHERGMHARFEIDLSLPSDA